MGVGGISPDMPPTQTPAMSGLKPPTYGIPVNKIHT